MIATTSSAQRRAAFPTWQSPADPFVTTDVLTTLVTGTVTLEKRMMASVANASGIER